MASKKAKPQKRKAKIKKFPHKPITKAKLRKSLKKMLWF